MPASPPLADLARGRHRRAAIEHPLTLLPLTRRPHTIESLGHAVDQGQGSQTFLCNERRIGTVYRSISLPAEIDDAKAEATFKNGVLELNLPKTAAAQVKRLTIH